MPGLAKKQMKIARVAPPRDKITALDFKMLQKNGKMKNAAKKKK